MRLIEYRSALILALAMSAVTVKAEEADAPATDAKAGPLAIISRR